MSTFYSRLGRLAALLVWSTTATAAPATPTPLNAFSTPALVTRLGSDPGIVALAFDADGRSLVSGGADGRVVVWDIVSGAPLLQRHFPPQHLILAADGHLVASVLTATELATAAGSTPGNAPLAAKAALGAGNAPHLGVGVWDIRSGQLRCAIYPFARADLLRPLITALAFAPDQRTLALAVGAIDYSVVGLWDTTHGTLSRTLPPIPGDFHASYGVPALAFAPGGKALLVSTLATRSAYPPAYQAAGDARLPVPVVGLWDTQRGQWQHIFPASRAPFCLSPDGKHLATTSLDRQGTQMWEVATATPLSMLKLVGAPVIPLRFAPDSQRLWCYSGALRLFDTQSGAMLAHLPTNPRVSRQIFSPDGRLLARGLDDGRVEIWHIGRTALAGK